MYSLSNAMLKKEPKTIDSQFLIRVIRSEVSPEENEYFLSWLSESEQNKEEFGNLVLVWDLADQSKISSIPDTGEQWIEIQKQISEANPVEELIPPHSVQITQSSKFIQREAHQLHKTDYAWLFRAAAVIIISLGLFYFIQLGSNYKQPQIMSSAEQSNPTLYELVTQKGERKTFPLADGSIVYLNSGSKLTYPKIFAESTREIEIEGEAYFTVSQDKERPFVVKSGKMITEVTGTEFNVRYRNNKVNVVVAKGSVKTFNINSNQVFDLSKGQMISFSERLGFSSPKRVNLNHYLAWRNNKFSFERTPLKDVMDEIERYYNIKVSCSAEGDRSKLLTGIFDTDSLDQIFSIISLTLDVNIDYKGNSVTIK